ncbi:MAG: TP0183 family DNA metabolism protein [Treponema sp.]
MKPIRKKIYCVFLWLFFSSLPLLIAVPRVAVYRIKSSQMNVQTVQTIDNLVFSFIKELKNYIVLDLRDQPVPEQFPSDSDADYVFFTSVQEVADGIQFELVLKGKEDQLTRLISKVYGNVNNILLDSRLLVLNLFDFSVALEKLNTAEPESVPDVEFGFVETVDALAGSWKGENGIERVMLLRGGRGMAVFSSGVSISLECKIEDGYLLITQKGALQPRQFLDLPDEIARQAIAKIQPPQWRFLISSDRKILSGKKFDAHIQHSNNTITDIRYEIADVQWQRD